jgi:hypothetical protein
LEIIRGEEEESRFPPGKFKVEIRIATVLITGAKLKR